MKKTYILFGVFSLGAIIDYMLFVFGIHRGWHFFALFFTGMGETLWSFVRKEWYRWGCLYLSFLYAVWIMLGFAFETI